MPKPNHALETIINTLPPKRHFPKTFCEIIPTPLRREQHLHTLLLFRKLSLHNPFACHSLHFLNQTPSGVQSLDIVPATNTPATDKHVGYRPPSGASRKCSL